MTSRSIVLGTAAVLLMSAATPLQIGFTPTAAYAQQQLTLEAAMAGNPSEFDAPQLRERIKLLRDAIQDGTLTGPDRRAAREKIDAYREVLDGIRAERQEARQDNGQAEQPAQGERTQQQVSEPRAERRAQQEERRADRRAEQEERRAERQAQQEQRRAERQGQQQQAQQQGQQQQAQQGQQQQAQQQQGQQQRQQQAQQNGAGLTPEMTAALRDSRPASQLGDSELHDRLQALRGAMRSGALSDDQRRSVQERVQADREVVLARRAGQTEDPTTEQPRQRERRAEREERSQQEVNRRAREIISDNRPAADLDNQELRQRLNQNRDILGTDQLSREQTQELRQQLREDREEMRARVTARQERQEEARAPDGGSRDRSRRSDDRMNDRDVQRIIEERTPSEQLTERELEQRVRVLSRALNRGNITVRQAEVARLLIGRDREELRNRLHAQRDRRRERRRSGSRDNVFVEFEVGYRPPPVIYAAEAMPRDIQMQLVAPPMYQIQRTYSVQEVVNNHDVREAMPGIEIDTLNFDFGSAEVRPEEIEKLDEIGMVIESIVAERPDEVFLIEGHTDAVGSDAANDVLSQQRALAVREALLDYFIIDPENLQTVGLGERYLKIHTPEPEEENRRVTVRRITPLLAGRG